MKVIVLMMPNKIWENMSQLAVMMAESHAVIAMRGMGAVGLWPVGPHEHTLMVQEKVAAFPQAMTGAAKAALSGGDPMAAALAPLQRQTRANVIRLSGRPLGGTP